jgi:hypothetical protein
MEESDIFFDDLINICASITADIIMFSFSSDVLKQCQANAFLYYPLGNIVSFKELYKKVMGNTHT